MTRWILLLIGILIPVAGFPQNTSRITFEEALRLSLRQNIDLQKARTGLSLQSQNLLREKADFLPDLNLFASPSQRYGLSFDQITGRVVQQDVQAFSINASSSLNLFNGFADVATLQQARYQLASSRYQLKRTEQLTLSEVARQFLQVILNQELIRIQEENLTAQQEQLKQIEAFVQAGARPTADLYQQQASVANAELQLINARRDYEVSAMQLVKLLALNPAQEYTFEMPPLAENVRFQPYVLEDLIKRAYQLRPDLRAQKYKIQATRQGIRAARAGYLPKVTLSANGGSNYTSLARQFNPALDFWEQLWNRNRGAVISLNIRLPLFDRFQTRSAVERARVDFRNEQLTLENLQREIALEIKQAYLDYETAWKRLDASEKQLKAARLALQAMQERYHVGSASLVELTKARADFVRASSERAQALYNFLFQKKLLELQTGNLDAHIR